MILDDNYQTGEIIKSLRKQWNWSLEMLGNLLGVQRAAVQKWENGTVINIKKDILEKMSLIFGVPKGFILGEIKDCSTRYERIIIKDQVESLFLNYIYRSNTIDVDLDNVLTEWKNLLISEQHYYSKSDLISLLYQWLIAEFISSLSTRKYELDALSISLNHNAFFSLTPRSSVYDIRNYHYSNIIGLVDHIRNNDKSLSNIDIYTFLYCTIKTIESLEIKTYYLEKQFNNKLKPIEAYKAFEQNYNTNFELIESAQKAISEILNIRFTNEHYKVIERLEDRIVDLNEKRITHELDVAYYKDTDNDSLRDEVQFIFNNALSSPPLAKLTNFSFDCLNKNEQKRIINELVDRYNAIIKDTINRYKD